jgi:hypothetical protein
MLQDFMGGYDYITVRAPPWLSHCSEKGGPESVRNILTTEFVVLDAQCLQ